MYESGAHQSKKVVKFITAAIKPGYLPEEQISVPNNQAISEIAI